MKVLNAAFGGMGSVSKCVFASLHPQLDLTFLHTDIA